MASKRTTNPTTGFPPTQWVVCELPTPVKDRLKKEKVNEPAVFKSLDNLVESGYKFSLSRDERADCVGCYLTAPRNDGSTSVRCLSARAPTVAAAIMVLLYKHYEMLQEDWSGSLKENGLIDPWG